MQRDPIGTILYSLVVRDADEGSNGEVSFTLNSPVSTSQLHPLSLLSHIKSDHTYISAIICMS